MNYENRFCILANSMKIIIKNISKIVQVNRGNQKFIQSKHLDSINTIDDGYIEIEGSKIKNFGSMKDWRGIDDWNNIEIIDAEGGCVYPSFCDSHTHLVFSDPRQNEFVLRIQGNSYEEIAKKGGGILNSAESLAKINEDELYEISLERLKNVIKHGTGAIEIKSGYGLSLSSEIKILRVIKRLKENTQVKIKSTLLAAHAVPKKYFGKKDEYIKLITEKIIPKVSDEKLADYIDVFCEKNYFDIHDTHKILKCGIKYGLKPKIHVNQFNSLGGIKTALENNAISVDHLEVINDEDIKHLKGSDTMATLLPSCSFFLNIPYAKAKKFISNNININLASDYNPGSSPSSNMSFVSSLGCIKLNLTPNQVINATTLNGAHAMEISENYGSIDIGKKANLFITKKIPSYDYLHYSFGENCIKTVILNGKVN